MGIIISAYACDPYGGSEDGLGWHYVCMASRRFETHVLTEAHNRENIEKYIVENKMDTANLRFYYIQVVKKMSTVLHSVSGRLAYIEWQYAAARKANEIIAQRDIQFVHHVTWATCVLPIQMYRVKAPLVYGPVGGGERIPGCIHPPMSVRDRLTEGVRVGLMKASLWFPSNRKTVRNAAVVLATTRETKEHLSSHGKANIHVMQSIGIPDNWVFRSRDAEKHREGTFHVMLAGRMLYWKGMDIGIEACKRLIDKGYDIDLTVVGRGRKMQYLQEISSGYSQRIHLIGAVEHEKMLKLYDEADCFVNCSYHDSGCFVILEAMSAGVPVVCLNSGGPGYLTTDDCAIRIQPAEYDTLIDSFADAIVRLMQQESLCRELAENGHKQLEKFRYSRKYDQILELMENC